MHRDTPKAVIKPLTFTLLRLLADGEFHSGEALAQRLGLSRASVNNALRDAAALGLTLHSVRGKGYRLAEPLQWLDAQRVALELGHYSRRFDIDVLDHAVSSNTLMLQRASQGAPSGSVLAVEWQTGGRGRMGRMWQSGLGDGLTFSVLWRFEQGLSALSGLSLAAGVAVIRTLHDLDLRGATLKWPNDVMTETGKLAGILIEAQGDMLGPSAVVIGIGLNLTRSNASEITQAVSALMDLGESLPDRNKVLAVLLRNLCEVLDTFGKQGFSALRSEWMAHHALQDQSVRLFMPDGSALQGVARGVAEDGTLLLETAQGVKQFSAGEISLRSAS